MSEINHQSLVELLQRRASADAHRRAYTLLDDAAFDDALGAFPEPGGPADAISYCELDRRAREIAARLQRAGVEGGRALLFFPPGIEFIAAFFGCLYAGVVAVPGYPPRSRRGLPRVLAVAADAQASVVLASAEDLPKLRAMASAPDVAAALAALTWIATDEPAGDDLAADWRDPGSGPQTLAFLQYTSGSTAAPKGVMVSHGNLLANQEQIRRAFRQTPESVVVGWLPLYHDMGLIGNVLQPLFLGAECVLMSPLTFLQRPRRWLEAITRFRATTSGGPNFSYELCVRKIPPAEREGLDLSSWRVAFNGAEPVRAATLERFAEAFAPQGFSRRAFLPCYGLAEATLLVSSEPAEEVPRSVRLAASELERGRGEAAEDTGDAEARTLVACGHVASELAALSDGGQRVVIVDPETRRPVAAGTVGEIWVQGPNVAGGYWRRPELSAETFEAELADGGGGPFLRTGDLGLLSDGRLLVTGRQKDLIIIRGRNLYPQDIELTAETAHPALRAGCGAAFSVEVGGEERLMVVQEVERTAIRQVDPLEVAERIRAAVIAEHQVATESVVLLAPGKVPKTSSGKVQRSLCRRQILSGESEPLHRSDRDPSAFQAPGDGADAADEEAPDPSTEGPPAAVATAGAAQWVPSVLAAAAAVLETPREGLESDRPLPLDSLAAMELKARLESETGRPLPLAELFDGPTAESIAAALASAEAAAVQPEAAAAVAERHEPPAEVELSEGQRALWLLERIDLAAIEATQPAAR